MTDAIPSRVRLRWRRLVCRIFGHKYLWWYTFREDFCLRCDHWDEP